MKQVIPGTLARYAFSIALGVPESELSLSSPELIAGASRLLVQRGGRGSISEREARAYGWYLFVGPRSRHSSELDRVATRRVLADVKDWRSAEELSQSVLRVAQLVGEVLLGDFDAMLKQSGWFGSSQP